MWAKQNKANSKHARILVRTFDNFVLLAKVSITPIYKCETKAKRTKPAIRPTRVAAIFLILQLSVGWSADRTNPVYAVY